IAFRQRILSQAAPSRARRAGTWLTVPNWRLVLRGRKARHRAQVSRPCSLAGCHRLARRWGGLLAALSAAHHHLLLLGRRLLARDRRRHRHRAYIARLGRPGRCHRGRPGPHRSLSSVAPSRLVSCLVTEGATRAFHLGAQPLWTAFPPRTSAYSLRDVMVLR